VIGRATVFLLLGCVGTVLSYGALYAFTPFGLAIIGACLAIAALLPAIGDDRWPEVLGLVAGPGVLFLLVAANTDDPLPWAAIGGALLVGAVVGYSAVGRGRCARRA
jgi:hypothetical protein